MKHLLPDRHNASTSFGFCILPAIVLLLPGCSPHPGAGAWKASEDNEYGISRLDVGYDGRARFVTTKRDNATWHCFWGATGRRDANLDCTSSANPEDEKRFVLSIKDHGLAELHHESVRIASFTRKEEAPVTGE